jgi:SpoVK/Ycf46/Vps4 family AAA+-type ATPase
MAYNKRFYQWNIQGGNFHPIGELHLAETIAPGYYSCERSMEGIYLAPLDIVLDGLINFNGGLADELMENVRKFWEAKPKFDKIKESIKLLYKRGFLLFGPPGCGKTSLVTLVVKDVIEHNGVAIVFDGVSLTTELIKAIRDINPTQRIVVIIEDLDAWCRRDEEGVLDMLDGAGTSFENIIFLATSNYANKIPKRMLRPSRFDFKLEMGYPSLDTRKQYLTNLFNSMNFDNKAVVNSVIEKMSNDTDQFSFADLKELFVSVALFGFEYDRILADIKDALHTEDVVKMARAKKGLAKTAITKKESAVKDEDHIKEEECANCGELKENCECDEVEPKN